MVGRYGGRLAIPERSGRGAVLGALLYTPRDRRVHGDTGKQAEPLGQRGLVYRAAGLAKGSPLVAVEGPSTALAAASLGFEPIGYPSASILGAAAWWRSLATGAEVYVMPDADDAGRAAGEQLARLLVGIASTVAVVDLFPDEDDGRDLADLLRVNGAEVTRQTIEMAMSRADHLPKPTRGRPAEQREKAEAYLRQVLSGGSWHSSSYVEAHRPDGMSLRTYNEARKRLPITSQKEGRTWRMKLTQDETGKA